MDRISPFDGIGTAVCSTSSQDALRSAGLDFDVESIPVKNPCTGKVIYENGKPKFYANIRRDTNRVIGITEERYRVIQNRVAFSVADPMIEEDGARITRVSCLGSRCFMNLAWPGDKAIDVLGDIVNRRAIIQNSHDANYSIYIRLMPFRVVCVNGLMVPVPSFSFDFRIKHSISGNDRLNESRQIMFVASRYFETFGQIAVRLAKTFVSVKHARDILSRVPDLAKKTNLAKAKVAVIMNLFDGGQVNASHESVKGTAWGLLNAVSDFADYSSGVRKSAGNNEANQRFKNAFEGAGMKLKLSIHASLFEDNTLGLKEFSEGLAA